MHFHVHIIIDQHSTAPVNVKNNLNMIKASKATTLDLIHVLAVEILILPIV